MTGAKTLPTVTVLMSVHNGEQFLHEAIDSILSQTFTDFELLAFDDCSTDQSLSILRSYAEADPRVRVTANPQNLGLTKTLNLGLSMARGTYIARMDADDVSLPNRLEKQMAFLEAHPAVAVLGACGQVIDESGHPIRKLTLPIAVPDIKERLLHGNCLIHTSVVIRADVMRDAEGYSEKHPYAQDYELWLRLAERVGIANLPDVLVNCRAHAGQVSIKKLADQWRIAETCRVAAIRRAIARGTRISEQISISKTPRERLTAAPGTLGHVYLHWARIYESTEHLALSKRMLRACLRHSPLSREAWHLLLSALADTHFVFGFLRRCVRRVRSFRSHRLR